MERKGEKMWRKIEIGIGRGIIVISPCCPVTAMKTCRKKTKVAIIHKDENIDIDLMLSVFLK